MTWSLAVEEQFYLVFPLIMLVLRKLSRRNLLIVLAVLCALSLSLSVVAEFRAPTMNFYSPLTRAWELGAGALLAVWRSGRVETSNRASWKTDAAGILGLLLIVVPILRYLPETRFPGYEAIPPALGAVLILSSAGGRANRILAIPPLVGVGLISYSLYLWHWPLLSFARIISANPLHPRTTVLLMSIAFAAATASYFFVEKPFRAKTSARTSTVLLAYACLILVLVGTSSIFYLTHGFPGRFPELAKVEAQANIDRDHPCLVSDFKALSALCIPPPDPGRPSFALLGDSHAEAISNRMRSDLANENWQLLTLAHGRCGPTKGMTRWISANEEESCDRFNRQTLKFVLSRPDIQVVGLLAGWGGRIYVPDHPDGSPEAQSAEQNDVNLKIGVRNEIAALEAAGKRVILIDDFPEFPFNPVESVRYQRMPMRRALNRLLLADEPQQWQTTSQDASRELLPADRVATAEFNELVATDPAVSFISLKESFCQRGQCYFANGSDLYYFDGDHLSDVGAMRIMPLFSKLLESHPAGGD